MTSESRRWKTRLGLILVIALMGIGCDSASVETEPPHEYRIEDDSSLVAFLIHYEDSLRIAVAPLNNPMSYRLLPRVDEWWDSFKLAWNPTFSPDKQFVFYDSGLLVGIHLATEDVSLIRDPDLLLSFDSRSIGWLPDSRVLATPRDAFGLFRVRLESGLAESVDSKVIASYGSGPDSTLLVLSPSSTLLIYRVETLQARPFPNPTVHQLNLEGERVVAMRNLSWSPENALIVGDVRDGIYRRIFVADTLSESVDLFETGFFDLSPRWGPQEWILFSRQPRRGTSGLNQNGSIYLLNSKTKELRLWLSPSSIPGAIGVDTPDY